MAPSSETWSRWAHVPWATIVLSTGIILTNAGFLASCWWMMHRSREQHHEASVALAGFHRELLDDMEQIVNLSPVQATADACQLRFRVRYPDGIDSPSIPVVMELFQRQKDNSLATVLLQMAKSSVANFGLVPPGEYRLKITNSMRMQCEHDFRVWPGVPVDRVVYLPRPALWQQIDSPFPLRIQSVWPTEWHSQPILAMYHLESGQTNIEGWTWKAPLNQRFHHWVVAGDSTEAFVEDAMTAALPNDLFEHPMVPTIETLTKGEIPLPYGTCELTAISFVLDNTRTGQGYVYLGTCRFAGGDSQEQKDLTGEYVTHIPQTAPRWEMTLGQPQPWPIEIPHSIVRQMGRRARQILGENTASARDALGIPEHGPMFRAKVSRACAKDSLPMSDPIYARLRFVAS